MDRLVGQHPRRPDARPHAPRSAERVRQRAPLASRHTTVWSGDVDLLDFSTPEPVADDKLTITKETGDQDIVTIIKIEEAGVVQVVSSDSKDEKGAKLYGQAAARAFWSEVKARGN